MRFVRPDLAKAIPMVSAPTMNQTDGSMKSVKAERASRIWNSAWMTPIAIAVTPTGRTSNTHQIAASTNRPIASRP